LVDVVLRRLELVAHELELGGVGEVGDWKHRLEHGLQTLVRAAAVRLLDEQELVVGRLLNLDEVRHLGDFLDLAEELADALATGERLCQRGLSLRPPRFAAARLPTGRNWPWPEACDRRSLAGPVFMARSGAIPGPRKPWTFAAAKRRFGRFQGNPGTVRRYL